ncbi:MAG TPA: DUF885 domain-containing protein [Vicinamibacterales bacterium]|jgi:uncharacterized protein (DUF885 family)|nr:DUF885 domain-containing protein [Vicinamibacterales bacterium]
MIRLLLLATVWILVAGQTRPAPSGVEESPIAPLAEELAKFRLERNPVLRLRQGLQVERLPDLSHAQAGRDAAFGRSFMDRLNRIDPKSLSHEDWLTREILRWEAEDLIETRFDSLPFLVLPYSTPIRGVQQVFALLPVGEPAERERFLSLLKQYAEVLGQVRARTADQVRSGIRIPQASLDLAAAFFAADLEALDRTFDVDTARLEGVSATDAESFRAAIRILINGQIRPATKALADDYGASYRTRAPSAVGLSQYPGGAEYYAWLVKRHTTFDVTPQEVHAIGLAEVERTNAAMAKVRERLEFKGTKAEFHAFLRTDPRFFPKSPDEIGEKLITAMQEMEPRLDAMFLRRPKAPYGVKRLDPRLEGAMTYGYYQVPTPRDPKGYYNYNGSKLESRSLLNVRALAFHELAPGHHFQINLQTENEALPPIRRETQHTAYTEGWGEYASSLGDDAGLFADPYDQYGRLMMDMFLSVRLVVDTGMNALGWSRERAMDYMREHTLESEEQIRTESLRYSVDMPGQALAYKMGSRGFRELRAKAETALGSRFDVRQFHDAVLTSGSLPMRTLETHVEWWIETQRAQR